MHSALCQSFVACWMGPSLCSVRLVAQEPGRPVKGGFMCWAPGGLLASRQAEARDERKSSGALFFFLWPRPRACGIASHLSSKFGPVNYHLNWLFLSFFFPPTLLTVKYRFNRSGKDWGLKSNLKPPKRDYPNDQIRLSSDAEHNASGTFTCILVRT